MYPSLREPNFVRNQNSAPQRLKALLKNPWKLINYQDEWFVHKFCRPSYYTFSMTLTCWRLFLSILGLGSMGNVCYTKSNHLQWVQSWWKKHNSVRGGVKLIYCFAQKAEYWYHNRTINLKMLLSRVKIIKVWQCVKRLDDFLSNLRIRLALIDGFTNFMHIILTKVVPDNLKACPRFVRRSNN